MSQSTLWRHQHLYSMSIEYWCLEQSFMQSSDLDNAHHCLLHWRNLSLHIDAFAKVGIVGDRIIFIDRTHSDRFWC